MAARTRSFPFGALELAVLLALAVGFAIVWVPWRSTAGQRADEALAIEAVHRIASAENAHRSAAGARTGESAPFATLAELAKEKLIDDPVARDDAGPHLELGGYRVEILRPERLERSGRVRWTRGDGRVDPSLAPIWFAVTAIPRRGANLGLRSFYLDAKGRLYAAEGVQDSDRDPSRAPPSQELVADREETTDGPVWRRDMGRTSAAR